MKNMLRWALCQTFGKVKGVAIHEALMGGILGELIRNTEEKAIGELLANMGAGALKARAFANGGDE